MLVRVTGLPSVDASVGGHDCILHCALLLVTRHTKVAHTGHRSEGFGLRLRLPVGFGFAHHMHAGTACLYSNIEYAITAQYMYTDTWATRLPLFACSCSCYPCSYKFVLRCRNINAHKNQRIKFPRDSTKNIKLHVTTGAGPSPAVVRYKWI